MPRVKSQTANKDYPKHGIKKGQVYYTWKFRYGGLNRSATYPKPSQLTRSEFLSTLYDIQEQAANLGNEEILNGGIEDIYSSLETLKDETQEKRDNMPEQLQEVGSGELLGERVEALDNILSELDTVKDKAETWYDEHGEKGYDLNEFSAGEADEDEDEESEAGSADEALAEAEEIVEEFRGISLDV